MSDVLYSIYRIKNLINGKSYIGFSNNPDRRLKEHIRASRLDCFADHNTSFKRAIRKYGVDAFELSVLEENLSHSDVRLREIFYIENFNAFKNGYNSTMGGDGMLGTTKSDETKDKIRQAHIGKPKPGNSKPRSDEIRSKISKSKIGSIRPDEVRLKISESRKGQLLSDEHKQKISEGGKGLKRSEETRKRISLAKTGVKKSEETILKMSNNAKIQCQGEGNPNAKTYQITEISTGEISIIKSLTTWANDRGIQPGCLYRVIRENRPFKGYYINKL